MTRRLLMPLLVAALGAGLSGSAWALPLFSGDDSSQLWSIDSVTGNATLIGPMGDTMTDLAISPSGDLYGISYRTLYSINKTTGATTGIGYHNVREANALVFDSAGTLYLAGGGVLATVNLGTGAASELGNNGFRSSGDLAFDASGILYLTAVDSPAGDSLLSLNPGNGAATLIGNIGYESVYGIAFDDSGKLIGITLTGDTIEIDVATGAGSFIAPNGVRSFGAAPGRPVSQISHVPVGGGPAPIPEPSTAVVFLLGSIIVGAAIRRHKRD